MAKSNAEIVAHAAGHALAAHRMPPICQASRRLYERIFERLARDSAGVPLLSSGSVNAWSVSRAAVARVSRERLLACVLRIKGGEAAGSMVDEMSMLSRIADAYPWNPEHGQPRQGAKRGLGSKRARASALPAGWLDDLWGRASRRRDGRPARVLDALAVAILTGCRPAEVEKGIRVEQVQDGILLTVQTAKAGAGSERRITMALDSAMAMHLHGLSSVGAVVVRYTADAFSSSIASIAGDTWGRRISAYDIRHARAADVRNQDGTAAASDMLGHTSRETLRYYGRRPRTAAGAVAASVQGVQRSGPSAVSVARISLPPGGVHAPTMENPAPAAAKAFHIP